MPTSGFICEKPIKTEVIQKWSIDLSFDAEWSTKGNIRKHGLEMSTSGFIVEKPIESEVPKKCSTMLD